MSNRTLQIGDRVPSARVLGLEGYVDVQDFIGASPLVIYFYPKDNTPGCTAQACAFRDAYEDFTDMGAQVIGISADSTESHAHFRDKYRLPFPLFSDDAGEACRAFGVSRGWLPGRVTFVADDKGIVRHVFSSHLRIGAHIENAKKEVRKLLDDQSLGSQP